jgi:hypothetical protein
MPSVLGNNGYVVRPHVLRGAADALTGGPRTLTDTKADVTANPLPPEVFGRFRESAYVADTHKQVVSTLDELLTSASKELQDLVDELYGRSQGYRGRDLRLHDEQMRLGRSRG